MYKNNSFSVHLLSFVFIYSKWESTGMKVLISTSDITTKPGCKELLNESTKLGPIGGIFNLALQLFDGALENQDATKFARCLAPKALATQYLDELSRKMCPDLKYFVVFSSAACGLGNAGQTNYGMANSAMERIIEQRHSDGLPAKAIQLGAIGDIGAAYDMFLKNVSNQSEVQISGCVPQAVWSFLDNLDTIISHPDPIILNIVLPEQKLQKQGQLTTVEKILHLLSSKNLKSIPPETTLSNLGADSIASMEISNILQKEFGVQITPKKIGALSISEMLELEQTHDSERSTNRG
jgi:fatty acid synthase